MTSLPAQFMEWLKACNERFARFSGSQFSSHELPSEEKASNAAKRLCLDCRKREVKARQRYCPHCARNRKRDSKRRHMRLKRALDVEKLANSPIGAEALTKPETQGGYHHPKTSIPGSSFSTGQGLGQHVSKAHGSITTSGGHNGQK
jgi:hypothetical protein